MLTPYSNACTTLKNFWEKSEKSQPSRICKISEPSNLWTGLPKIQCGCEFCIQSKFLRCLNVWTEKVVATGSSFEKYDLRAHSAISNRTMFNQALTIHSVHL